MRVWREGWVPMTVFDHVVVGVDGTDWGLEALRQALVTGPFRRLSCTQ